MTEARFYDESPHVDFDYCSISASLGLNSQLSRIKFPINNFESPKVDSVDIRSCRASLPSIGILAIGNILVIRRADPLPKLPIWSTPVCTLASVWILSFDLSGEREPSAIPLIQLSGSREPVHPDRGAFRPGGSDLRA